MCKPGGSRGASEVRHETSSMHFHCPAPRSSNHIGRGERPELASALQKVVGDFLRADFWEGDEDSNFSVFRVRRFSEWPEPLHWIAFPVEILTKPLIHWIASPLFTENPFFSVKGASSHPLPKNLLWFLSQKKFSDFASNFPKDFMWVFRPQSKSTLAIQNM